MSKQSTALLAVGPRSVAPWNDRVWRISSTAQLVEGSIPYWIVTPTQPAMHPVSNSAIEVVTPYSESVVDSILVFLGAHFGNDEVENLMSESHNMTVEYGVREVAAFYELAIDTRNRIASSLSQSLRLGFTRLDEFSLVDNAVLESLREMGFDIDVFTLEPGSSIQV